MGIDKTLYIPFVLSLIVCICGHVLYSTHVAIKGELYGVDSFHLLCGLPELNSGHQACLYLLSHLSDPNFLFKNKTNKKPHTISDPLICLSSLKDFMKGSSARSWALLSKYSFLSFRAHKWFREQHSWYLVLGEWKAACTLQPALDCHVSCLL